MSFSIEQQTEVMDLYARGLYLQAYEASKGGGPLREWTGGAARILAGRLAAHLGAPRLGRWHHLRAWREEPDNPEACYYCAWSLLDQRGPYGVRKFIRRVGDLPHGSPDIRSSWFAFEAHVAALLRDFDSAEEKLQAAEATLADSPWVQVERAGALELEDRYEEALASARRAFDLEPWYRPGVQVAAHILTLLDRDDDALELLAGAAERLESSTVLLQLAALQLETGLYSGARDSLDRYVELCPLMEVAMARMVSGIRSDVAYFLGDVDAAIEHAREAKSPYYEQIAGHLEDRERRGRRRVTLPVGFVRQHHMTCAPATLTAIGRFWSKPAEHLQVAEEICYDGTSCYSERRWAEDNGWAAREFTTTKESIVALIDGGMPFTLSTVTPGNSHMQAVIGYDGKRGTVTLRDPFVRNSLEVLAGSLLEGSQSSGPRGMALVPAGEQARLDAVDLPDAALWDQLHSLDAALERHERPAAEAVYEAMRATAPGHRLTSEARRHLAIYDANPHEVLAATEELLALYPDDQVLLLTKLSCLRDLARRDDRLELYGAICERRDSHPVFWQQYAQELLVDARDWSRASLLLRQAINRWPGDSSNYHVLATLRWSQRRYDEALDLHRLAACLDDKDEHLAQAYFVAAQHLKKTEEVLDFLRKRFVRLGEKSSLPARTLDWAYRRLERPGEGLRVLEEAMRLRPDDGELQLHAADAYAASTNEHADRADRFLRSAEQKSPRRLWLRTAARMAWHRGQLGESLDLWQQVLELQPLSIDAQRAVTQLLAETQGTGRALEHLAAAAGRFPYFYPLQELRLEWLRDEPDDRLEPVIRDVVKHHPHDAWVRRELAMLCVRKRCFDEARLEAEVARRLEPTSPSTFNVLGEVLRAEGKREEAMEAYRGAIRLSVDVDWAITALIGCCRSAAERREALAFVQAQLVEQVIHGDGLLSFREHAAGTLNPDELLASLREALQARPDLWHAWSACIHQLLAMNRLDEATDLAVQATDRFPLLPRLWHDRSHVARATQDPDAERDALETAYRIQPGWSTVVRALCELHERDGESERSRRLLEQAILRSPLDPTLHAALADLLWRSGEKEAALDRVQHAVRLSPGYEWAWAKLGDWSRESGCPERCHEAARDLTVARPGETRSWIVLARTLSAGQLGERLAALDRAIELNPRSVESHELRAALLAEAGRYDEAREACNAPVWSGHVPLELRLQAARIDAQQGRIDAAITAVRAVLDEEPDDHETWRLLADWCHAGRRTEEFLEASRALARIAPQDPLSLAYLGEAQLVSGDRRAARETFARAFEIEPGYEYVALSLFDLQLAAGDTEAASSTLAVARRHLAGPFVAAREAQLAVKLGEIDGAVEVLEALCGAPDDPPWAIHAVVASLVEAGQESRAEAALAGALRQSAVHPFVGSLWVERRLARGDFPGGDELQDLSQHHGAVGRQAACRYVDWLARCGRPRRVRRFVEHNASWLRESALTWGNAGYALRSVRLDRRVIEWMADWRQRPDAEPWMLVNLAEALRDLGRSAAAREVSRAALCLEADHGSPLHSLWLAADELAVERNPSAAAAILASIDAAALDDDYRFLHTVLAAALEIECAPAADRAALFAGVARRLDDAARSYRSAFRREPARRRVYCECLSMIARASGGWRARLWCWGRQLRARVAL